MEKSILIVDDNAIILESTSNIVKEISNQWKVECAHNGVEAMEKVEEKIKKRQSYTVILSDYEMPRMNGIELRRSLKNLSFNGKFYLMSGSEVCNELIENVNIDGFLPKPFGLHEIREIIERRGKNN